MSEMFGRVGSDTRGDAPLIGVVLLFGMVFIGVAAVAITGMVALDALEGESEIEQTRVSMDETNHRLATVSETGTEQPIGSATVRDDGAVSLIWFDNDSDLPTPEGMDSDPCGLRVDSFGAITEDVSDRTIAYQGGGVWERTGETTVVRSSPPLTYEDGALSFDYISLASGDKEGSDAVARLDSESAQDLSETLGSVGEGPDCDQQTDFAIAIESTFYQGWHTHLENELEDEANATVMIDHDQELTIASLENARTATPAFDLTADVDRITTVTDKLTASVTVTNVGTATGEGTVTFSVGTATKTVGTDAIAPGESATYEIELNQQEVRDGLGISASPDIETYDAYEYTVKTSDASERGTFFYSLQNTFYRLDQVNDTDTENVTTVVANLTNIGNAEEGRDIIITLESDTGALEEPLTYTESIQGEAWEDSTVAIDFNRSALPDGTYTYTVEVDNQPQNLCNHHEPACMQSGSFEIEDGAIGGVDEIIVTEPSDVSVSILGTEISGEYGEEGNYYKNWGAVTASAVIGDTRYRFLPNGGTEQIPLDEPHYTEPGTTIEDYNLNTYGTQTDTYDIETAIESGSITIEATYWPCANWVEAGTDDQMGGTTHYDCGSFDVNQAITVEGGGAGDANTDHGLMMTRTTETNEMPDIERGFPLQRSVNDVFEDGTDDVELIDNELLLEDGDFAFMMETTMTQSELQSAFTSYPWHQVNTSDQSEMNLAAWDIAANYRNTDRGDPNFNDIIGFVQIDGGESYIDLEDPKLDFRIDGEKREPERSGTSPAPVEDDNSISVGTDAIVIS
ncbi:hypothetical protein ACLI4U_02810 [Natrialbaceae archaeon A-CW2]